MPNDHRGITLVELIIAIAISTVILGAATLFLGMAHKNYNHASAQIDLQSESQILMEQIGMWETGWRNLTHPCPVSVGSPFIRFRTPRR
mgnify:CR=1 FL=1